MTIAGRRALAFLAMVALAGIAPVLAAGDDDTVVVSRPGVVYHKAGSQDVRGRGHERPLSEALSAGYSPCPICFSRSGGSTSATALMTASAVPALSKGVVLPPGLVSPGVETQPFGLKIGTLYPQHGNRGGVRDPYIEVHTITRPASEQGAFGNGH
jgi:hypothetical protein